MERELARLGAASIAADLGSQALQRLLALATLTGSLTADGVRRLAAPELEIVDPRHCGPTQIVDRLAALPWWDRHNHSLPALTPDLVAAALSAAVFDGRSDLAANWLWPAIADRIDVDFARRLGRVIYDMDRVRLAGPSPLPEWLESMIDAHPERSPAFVRLCFDELLPHRLAGFSAKIGLALADGEDVTADDSKFATMLNNTSVHLRDAGRTASALAAARRTVEIYERLAAANPARFEPDLATSVNNLANILSEAGEGAAALAAARRAVEIYERLAAANAARFEPDLAMSVNNLANRLSEAGEGAAALAAARRAVEIRERLAAADPARFEPDLAMSVNNLANRLSEAGEDAAALAAARRTVEI